MNTSLTPVQPSADTERSARVDLAACYRLADRFGLNEGIDNHLTLLVPGYVDKFLLAPYGMHWSEIKASDFLVVDFSGRVLSGQGSVEDTAFHIHQPVHRLSPQGRCVLHTHMPYATALSMLQNPRLEMAVQSALGFYEDVAYDSTYNGLALDASEGERMARVLGNKSVLMLANHGVLVVGNTISQAFERLYFLERAAQAQVLALSTGRPLQPIPEEVIKKTVGQFGSGGVVGGRDRVNLHADLLFDALKRVLDRSHSDYAS